MKLAKTSRIEKACASPARLALAQPHLNVEKARIEATDTFVAVRVPVEIEEGDETGPVPADAFTTARTHASKTATEVTIACNTTAEIAGVGTFVRPVVAFPNLDALWPTGKPQLELGVDPWKLVQVAEAMGLKKGMGVRISIDSPERAFRGDDASLQWRHAACGEQH